MRHRGRVLLQRIRDYARSIAISDLNRDGVFAAGPNTRWILEWVDGEGRVTSEMLMTLLDRSDGLRARFTCYLVDKHNRKLWSPHDQQTPFPRMKPIEHVAPVVRHRKGKAGARFMFVCTADVDGIRCRRPVDRLYIPLTDYLPGCSRCHDLTYLCRLTHDPRMPLPQTTLHIRRYLGRKRSAPFPRLHRPGPNEAWLTHGLRGEPYIASPTARKPSQAPASLRELMMRFMSNEPDRES